MQGESAAAAVSAATQAVQAAPSPAQGAAAVSGATQIAHSGLALVFGKLEYFVMVPMVYLAWAFLLVAVVVKIVQVFASAPMPYQLAIYPARKRPFIAALGDTFGMGQILKRRPMFWFFLVLYHVGFALLILGHLDIIPGIGIVRPESRHMLGAGVAGLMVTIPAFYFLGRRFKAPDRHISVPSDYLLLLLILFVFLFGDMISWGNSWTASGFVMTKKDFGKYFEGLVRFTFADPRQVLHGSHYHFIVLHVLLANILLFVVPFSKIMHAFFALPINAIRRTVWSPKGA